ncbi:XRE family transcriptional regulator [Asticcacaulis taihuensis]|uniref:XRE family transcriptional regulator n=1 Tax=Asticcacaulis taihuensis TaxID=260084 RepID=UPI0026EDDE23|nr:S24 family peptidase [Asticcacaulis taihuensis]
MTSKALINTDRLVARMEHLGKSQAGLARAIGISQQAIGKLVSGESRGSKFLHEIARHLETTPAYLTGQTDDPDLGALPLPTPELIAEQLDVVQLPEIDLSFGMGGGAIYDRPVKSETMAFSRAWIRHFTNAPTSELFFARGMGDSMFPTIADGDILLIDGSQKTPAMFDQIWALTQYGHGMIKRLRPTENGYKILSDNPAVPADTAADDSMTIIGRVVATMRRI